MFENSHNKSGRRHKTQIFNNLLAAAMTGSQVYFSCQLDFLQMGEIQLYVVVGPWPLLGWKLLEVIHKYRSLSWVPHSHPTHIQFACFCPIWLPFSSAFLGPILPSPPLPCASLSSTLRCVHALLSRHFEDETCWVPLQPRGCILYTEEGAGHSTIKAHSREALDPASHPSP